MSRSDRKPQLTRRFQRGFGQRLPAGVFGQCQIRQRQPPGTAVRLGVLLGRQPFPLLELKHRRAVVSTLAAAGFATRAPIVCYLSPGVALDPPEDRERQQRRHGDDPPVMIGHPGTGASPVDAQEPPGLLSVAVHVLAMRRDWVGGGGGYPVVGAVVVPGRFAAGKGFGRLGTDAETRPGRRQNAHDDATRDDPPGARSHGSTAVMLPGRGAVFAQQTNASRAHTENNVRIGRPLCAGRPSIIHSVPHRAVYHGPRRNTAATV